jgi:arsenite methyltransferase
VLARIASQLGRPRGRAGRAVAAILNRGNRATNERALALLEVRPRDRALDLGFGGGVGLEMLLASGAASVTGVDRSPDMVDAARRRFDGRVQVAAASVDALPFPPAAFDRVMSCHTLYFWPDPAAGVRELARVVAPGGRVVLAIRPRALMERQPLHRHGFALYTADELRDVLAEGFATVRIVEDPTMVYGVADAA